MRFSTVFAVLASGAMALAAAVSPAALVARGDDQALAIIDQLKVDVEVAIGGLGQCQDIECNKEISISLQAAFTTACDSFAEITVDVEVDISSYIADIYIEIFEAIQVYTSNCDETLVEEVIEIYASLDEYYCNLLNVVVVFFTEICVSVGNFLRVQVDLIVYLDLNELIQLTGI